MQVDLTGRQVVANEPGCLTLLPGLLVSHILALPVSTPECGNHSVLDSAGQSYKMPLSAGHSQWLYSEACGDAICFTLTVESCAWTLFPNLPSL